MYAAGAACRARTKEQCARTSLIAYCRSSTVVCIVLAMAAHLITIRRHSSLARAPDKTSIEIHAVRPPSPSLPPSLPPPPRTPRPSPPAMVYHHRRGEVAPLVSFPVETRTSRSSNVDATSTSTSPARDDGGWVGGGGGRAEEDLHTASRGTCTCAR